MEGNYVIRYGRLLELKEEIKDEPEDFYEAPDQNEPDPDEESSQGNFLPGPDSLPTDQVSTAWDDNDIKSPIPSPADSPLNIQIPVTWDGSNINLAVPELSESLPQIVLHTNQSDFYPLNSGFRIILQPSAQAPEPSLVPATDQMEFCVANNLSQVGEPRIQTVQTVNLSSNANISGSPANVLDNYDMLLQENESYEVQNYDLEPTNESQERSTSHIQISTVTSDNSSPARNFNSGFMCLSASTNTTTTTDYTGGLQSAAEANDSHQQENPQEVQRRPASKTSKTTADPSKNLEPAAGGRKSKGRKSSRGGKRRRPAPKKRKTSCDPPTDLEIAAESNDGNQRENSMEVQFGGPGHIDPNHIPDPTTNLQPIAGGSNSEQPMNLKPVKIGCPIPLDPKITSDLTRILQSEIGAGNLNLPQNFEPVLIRLNKPTDTDATLNPYRRRLRSATRASQQNFNALLICAGPPTEENLTIDPTKNLQAPTEAKISNRSQNLEEVQRGGPTPTDDKPHQDLGRNLQLVPEANSSNETQNLNPILIRAAAPSNPKLTTEITKILQPVAGATNSNPRQYFNAFLVSPDPTTDQDQTIEPPGDLKPAEGAGNSNRRKNSQGVQRGRPAPKNPTNASDPATNLEPAAGGSKSKRRKSSRGGKRRRPAPKKRKTSCDPPTDLEIAAESNDPNQGENLQEVQPCVLSSTDREATSEAARNLESAAVDSNSTGPQNSQEEQHGGPADMEPPNRTVDINRILQSLDDGNNDFEGQIANLEPVDTTTLMRVVRVLQWVGSITRVNEPSNTESQETAGSTPQHSRAEIGLARLLQYVAENPNQAQKFNPDNRATDTRSTLNPTTSLGPASEVGNSIPSQNPEESQRQDPASTEPTSSLQPAVAGSDSNQVQYFTPLKIVVPSCLVSPLTTQIARNLKPAIEAGNAQNSLGTPPGGHLPPQPQLILELSGIQEFSARAPSSNQPEPEPEPVPEPQPQPQPQPESSSLIQFSGSVPPDPKLTFQFRGSLQPIDREDQPEPRKKLYQLRIHSLTPKFPIPPLVDDEVQFLGMRSRNLEPAWIEPIDDEVQFIGSTSRDPQAARIGDGVGSCDTKSENPEPAPIGDEVGSCGTEIENLEPARISDEVGSCGTEIENLEPARISDEVGSCGTEIENLEPARISDEVGRCGTEIENLEPAPIGDEAGSCGTEFDNVGPEENCNELLIRPHVPSNLKRGRSFNDGPPAAKIPKRADNICDDHNYCSAAKNPELAQNSSENPTCSLAPTKPKLTFDFTGLRSFMAVPNHAGCIECTGQFSGKSDDTKRVDQPDSGSTVKYETSDIQSATTSTGTSSKTCKYRDVLALYASFKPRVYWHCSVPHCPAIFEEESEKDKHEAFHKSFPDNLFQCDDCKSRFHCFRFSPGQISMCKSLEQMKCFQRNYDSPRSLQLKKHIARHISRMDCTECKREYPYIDKLTKHVIDSHHRSVVFQCTKCPSCFVLSEFISRHICVRDIDDPECELSPFIQIKEHWYV